MLISCNRLKKYIKDSNAIDWKNIWSLFTVRTAEVEDVIVKGNYFDGVVVAEIMECEEHPDSDHMHVLKVDCGEEKHVQIVCGAPNVRVGLKTALVRVGGHIDGMEIKARPLRGIESFGMCCSGRELGISDNHEGILEFPSSYENGKDVKEYLPVEDIIVEIDNKSLTNRPDLWGHYGIAREISALTGHELLPLEIEEIINDKNDLDIKILDKDLCNRYCGLKIENILNNQTPIDMQIFLYYVGMRSISLLVDLTNVLMLELGQPMHAFDGRVVKSIEVGKAIDGDKYTTLDGVERTLTSDMLMIKNDNKYFGVAGVMGGLDSEILEDTTSVFLESANFDAGSIRKTAVSLGLRTEASARYEKSLDPNITDLAIKRFVYLLKQENPDLIVASNLTDVYPNVLETSEIILTKEKLAIYMGKTLEDEIVVKILESLGFKVDTNDTEYNVLVPTFRHSKDIKIPEDLIEEIARIYGFENITSESLMLSLASKKHEDVYEQEYNTKYLLANKFDMHEVHSYMWYDSNLLKELNVSKDGVKLLGKTENNILRDDLSFSLLNIVNENFKYYKEFKLFEIGTIVKDGKNKRVLSIINAGEVKNFEDIYKQSINIVKYIFSNLKNISIGIVQNNDVHEYYDGYLSKKVMIDGKVVGQVNVLNKNLTNKISKKKVIVTVDIDFDVFVLLDKKDILAKEVSKFPVVELDYTVILPVDLKYVHLKNVLDNFKSNLIKKFELVGVYDNKYTVRYTLGSDNKTLNQDDLLKFKTRFIDFVKENNFNIFE